MDNILPGNRNLDALVEELDALYPHYLPTPKDDLALVMYRAGQRSVVEYIKDKG